MVSVPFNYGRAKPQIVRDNLFLFKTSLYKWCYPGRSLEGLFTEENVRQRYFRKQICEVWDIVKEDFNG